MSYMRDSNDRIKIQYIDRMNYSAIPIFTVWGDRVIMLDLARKLIEHPLFSSAEGGNFDLLIPYLERYLRALII